MHQFDVATVVHGVDRPEEIGAMLGQFGCETQIVRRGDMTVFVNRERSLTARCAMASVMRKLECLHVKFDYIAIGDDREAIDGYEAALADLDALAHASPLTA